MLFEGSETFQFVRVDCSKFVSVGFNLLVRLDQISNSCVTQMYSLKFNL